LFQDYYIKVAERIKQEMYEQPFTDEHEKYSIRLNEINENGIINPERESISNMLDSESSFPDIEILYKAVYNLFNVSKTDYSKLISYINWINFLFCQEQ